MFGPGPFCPNHWSDFLRMWDVSRGPTQVRLNICACFTKHNKKTKRGKWPQNEIRWTENNGIYIYMCVYKAKSRENGTHRDREKKRTKPNTRYISLAVIQLKHCCSHTELLQIIYVRSIWRRVFACDFFPKWKLFGRHVIFGHPCLFRSLYSCRMCTDIKRFKGVV